MPTIVTIVPPFLSMNFQLVEGGRCRLRQKPATARNHPTPNKGYQACISNAKAMEGRPARLAFPARRSFSCAPFPRVEHWLALSRIEPLSARCSFAPKLARAPLVRSEVWPVRCSAVPPLRTLAHALLLRLSFAPRPCPCLLLVATPRLCPINRCLRHA